MRNWAGNHTYRARRVHEPATVEELQGTVRTIGRFRVLGSRHSFNDIGDTTGDLVSIAGLPPRVEMDTGSARVTVSGGLRYGEFCGPLDDAGLALHNMASLPHISVAGACATATHGSGVESRTLAAAVVGMELVRPDGAVERVVGGALDGAVVSLGALGVVTAVTLQAEPSYRMRQDVFEDLPQAAFIDRFGELAAMADSVSFFTEWTGPRIDQVWVKRRVGDGTTWDPPPDLHGATRATVDLHPIRRLSAAACTPQLGVPGGWHERLPHFRMGHTPSSGAELQSEYFVGRDDAVEAYLALDALRDRIGPLVQVTEIRTVAADDQWLSPAYHRASVAFHFTWEPDPRAVEAALVEVEAALEPFEPRPHWGKLFAMRPAVLRSRYERLPEFVSLAQRFDPEGRLRNPYLDRLIFGPGG